MFPGAPAGRPKLQPRADRALAGADGASAKQRPTTRAVVETADVREHAPRPRRRPGAREDPAVGSRRARRSLSAPGPHPAVVGDGERAGPGPRHHTPPRSETGALRGG